MKALLTFAAALGLSACAAVATGANYKVKVQLPSSDLDNTMSYIVDFDNGARLDSTVVKDGMATFAGSVDAPVLARLIFDGKRGPMFVLEQGDITVSSNGEPQGGRLNTRLAQYGAKIDSLMQISSTLGKDSVSEVRSQQLEQEYKALMRSTLDADGDNPVGLYFFTNVLAYEMTPDEFAATIKAHPSLAKSERVKKLMKTQEAKLGTMAGQKFKDFTVEYNGKTEKLSDYVGKGKYTLVDFWASWCGPCRREIKNLKTLNDKFGDKGLEVLGVAVWDEPENTIQAVNELQIPWHVIMNAQSIPTDIYGIPAIPSIILFDPEGNIVFRDLMGEELIEAVSGAMEN